MQTTLEAIDKALEDNQETGGRGYLGFSEIGDKCSRKLWYSYHRPKQASKFPASTLKKFADGHAGEDIMAARLQAAGIKLYGRQNARAIGNFQGHCDGIIEPLENPVPHVWEHKCTEKTPMPDITLIDWNYQYYCQAQMYMYTENIHRHYMTISSAGERSTIAIFTEYNPDLVKELLQKAEYIMTAETPPDRISRTPAFSYCKHMCQYSEKCHEA